MSLRLLFGSCDLASLRAALGSRRDDLVAAVVAEARGRWDVSASEAGRPDANLDGIVRRAIFEGVPFSDLDDETILHVAAADALASVAGAARPVAEASFKALWLQRMNQIPPLQTQGFGWLVDGRPLFGAQFATNWAYYGFAARERVVELIGAVARALNSAVFVPDEAPLDGDEAMAQLARDKERAERLVVEGGDLHGEASIEQWLRSLLSTERRSFLHRHWFTTATQVLERQHGPRAPEVLRARLYPAFEAWREDTPFTHTDRDELARLGKALSAIEATGRDAWFAAS